MEEVQVTCLQRGRRETLSHPIFVNHGTINYFFQDPLRLADLTTLLL
jgi:hypothetical protein